MPGSLLNLGCGRVTHADWLNIDLVSHDPTVTAHDLSTGIPLQDGSVSAVFHSHVLEHIRRPDAVHFLKECVRVLEPGGLIRVVVPDIEALCRLYLAKLELAASGDANAAHDRDWLALELLDQSVREQSGGQMATYMRQDPIPNLTFVRSRIADVADEMLDILQGRVPPPPIEPPPPPARGWRGRRDEREKARLLSDAEKRALAVERFRAGGEIHQWMYDGISLARLLADVGFVDARRCEPGSSAIPEFARYGLEQLDDGTERKASSLYMEARKPRT